MTNSINSCQYLKSVIISHVRQFNIKLVFIYAEDFNTSSILAGIMQIANTIVSLDKLDELTALDGVYLDKNGNPLNKPEPIRHNC